MYDIILWYIWWGTRRHRARRRKRIKHQQSCVAGVSAFIHSLIHFLHDTCTLKATAALFASSSWKLAPTVKNIRKNVIDTWKEDPRNQSRWKDNNMWTNLAGTDAGSRYKTGCGARKELANSQLHPSRFQPTNVEQYFIPNWDVIHTCNKIKCHKRARAKTQVTYLPTSMSNSRLSVLCFRTSMESLGLQEKNKFPS